MNLDKFEKIINEAFENKEKINANADKSIIDAIRAVSYTHLRAHET